MVQKNDDKVLDGKDWRLPDDLQLSLRPSTKGDSDVNTMLSLSL